MKKASSKRTEKSWSDRLARIAAMSPVDRRAAYLRGMAKKPTKSVGYKVPI